MIHKVSNPSPLGRLVQYNVSNYSLEVLSKLSMGNDKKYSFFCTLAKKLRHYFNTFYPYSLILIDILHLFSVFPDEEA